MAVPGPGRQPGRGSLQEGAAAPEAGHAAGGGPEALREAAQQALRQQRGQQGLTDRVASLSGYAEYVQIYYTILKNLIIYMVSNISIFIMRTEVGLGSLKKINRLRFNSFVEQLMMFNR